MQNFLYYVLFICYLEGNNNKNLAFMNYIPTNERFPKHANRLKTLLFKRERAKNKQAKQVDKKERPARFNGMREFVRLHDTTPQCNNYLESRRYKDGIYCAHCGVIGEAERLEDNYNFLCRACGETFNVLTNSMYDLIDVSLPDWLMTMYLENSFNGGVTTGELEKQVTCHRQTLHRMVSCVREFAYHHNGFNKAVDQYDENGNLLPKTYYIDVMLRDGVDSGRQSYRKHGHDHGPESALIFTIIQEGGYAFSYIVESESAECVLPIIYAHIPNGSIVISDKHTAYETLGTGMNDYNPDNIIYIHYSVNHSEGEYGRIETINVTVIETGITYNFTLMISNNRIEGYHGIAGTGFAKFRNSITAVLTFLYTNASNFRYNTCDLNESEKLDMAVDISFSKPVYKNEFKARPKYKRKTLLQQDKERNAMLKAGIKKPRQIRAELKAGRDARREARKQRQAQQQAKRQAKQEKKQAKELELQNKRQAKLQKRQDKVKAKQDKKQLKEQKRQAKEQLKQAKQQARQAKKANIKLELFPDLTATTKVKVKPATTTRKQATRKPRKTTV
jgi:hypothetical protein